MNTETVTSATLVRDVMTREERSMKWTADKSGMHVGAFKRRLNGGGEFTVSELVRIGKALGVHPATLLPPAFHTQKELVAA